ncbi:recombination protein RecR [Nautilia sp. PV-1]|uniref:recombination mediator RecR n=1 Tax=Nautilia sp. PV-1 TaxID=2579250 RepID=UPI000FD7109D|nr:recombination mediator RecR [Nautilia sp. PV-1]AZV46618.1 recombination protein RecR [Nautilia sp. PV-1]
MKDLQSLNRLIEAFEELPSIGKKSATRLAISIAKDKFKALKLINAIEDVVANIKECEICGNFSEHEICDICSDEHRDKTLAVVENSKDIITIEESGSYKGYYFVLTHIDDEIIEKLKNIIREKKIEELIFAFPPSVESEARSLYIEDKLKDLNIEFTQIAQGVPTGVHFENVDVNSLAKAIKQRFKL